MQSSNYQLSDFEILDNIGQGSFSKVKLVRRIQDAKILALKQVNMDKLSISEKNSALNEIRLLASISSPYVISYEGSFYSAKTNSLCLLMEYADNGDLESVINETAKKTKMERGLHENFIWRTIIHLLQGLKTLHDNKIVHRDLKSANIFYSKGIAKLGDFNVSSVSDSSYYSTKTGTPYYTAPEIWKGEKYTTNCDIWSLGCILYEMCALLPPFRGNNFPELFVAVSKGQYATLSLEYSEDLRTFVRLCLNVNSYERPSACELLNNPLLVKRFCDFKDDIDYSGKVNLIKPLKCPKILRFINSILPKANQGSDEQFSIRGSPLKEKIMTKKKADSKTERSIIDLNTSKQLPPIKSSIRIKSCKRIKTVNNESKSMKLIPQRSQKPSIHESALELKPQQTMELKPSQNKTIIRNEKFRVRSRKNIEQKQNYI